MTRINLITRTMGRRTLLVTMMMTITQKYASNYYKTFPLNFVADPCSQCEVELSFNLASIKPERLTQ